MSSENINSKKETFKADIQKTIREKHFHDIRENVVLSRRVNEALEQFIKNQSQEIPQVCIIDIACIDMKQLEPFLDLLKSDQLQLIKKKDDKRQNTWFFDCTSVTNLKFMTQLCKMSVGHILAGFFHATVEAYRQYYNFSVKMQLIVQLQGCQISENYGSKEVKEWRKLFEFMESPEGTQKIAALLDFWGAYISKNQDYIFPEHLVIMMKLFELFEEQSGIFSQQASLSFILMTLIYIRKMKILDRVVRRDRKTLFLAENCFYFVDRLKRRMPFLMKKHVEYGQFYPEIAQILVEFQKCNLEIFYEFLLQCQNLSAYLEGLLLRSKRQDRSDVIGKRVGLRLLNCLMESKKFYKVYNLERAIKITCILCDQLMLLRQFQVQSTIFLLSLMQGDWKHNFVDIFEAMNYKKLIIVALHTEQAERKKKTYDMLIKIMEVYKQNKVIYDALLIECDLEAQLWQFYRQTTIIQCHELLTQLVSRNMIFFVKNYRKTVEELCYHYQKANLKVRILSLKILKELNELTTDQKL